MKSISVQKGKKWFWPWQLPWPVLMRRWRGRYWLVRFDESARYELPNGYKGWNKGGGIIFSLLKNDQENHLWAWRWHEGLGVVQLTAYSNRPDEENGRIVGYPSPGGDVLMTAKPGDLVEIMMQHTEDRTGVRYTFFNAETGRTSHVTHPTRKPFWLAKLSGFWFGGLYPAPHRITIKVRKRGYV
jgi:hypothetical protein